MNTEFSCALKEALKEVLQDALTDVTREIQKLSAKVDVLSKEILQLKTSGSYIAPVHLQKSNLDITPGYSHYRGNYDSIKKLICGIPQRESTRKEITFQYLKFGTDDIPFLETLPTKTVVDDQTLGAILLPDQELSMPYEEVCKLLGIADQRDRRLSRNSKRAVKLLQDLQNKSELFVQKGLYDWFNSTSCCAVDTSQSPLDLPLFKFAQNGRATASAKPDGTCLVLPLKLEIKDTVGKHGKGYLVFFSDILIFPIWISFFRDFLD